MTTLSQVSASYPLSSTIISNLNIFQGFKSDETRLNLNFPLENQYSGRILYRLERKPDEPIHVKSQVGGTWCHYQHFDLPPLIYGKLATGHLLHSSSLVADGFNNVSDIIGNVALLIGIRMARQPQTVTIVSVTGKLKIWLV